MAFKKAEKRQAKLRLALCGPTGSGKTYSALAIGTAIAQAVGTKVAVVDTERNSACLYSDKFEFDVDAEMTSFSPHNYIEKLKAASEAGYGVLVIDSLSHAWTGEGGALSMVDRAAASSRSGNNFTAWREVTPHHNRLVESILSYPGHLITTMRSKMEYVQEKDERGRTTIRKVGLAPIQRDGMEYEFTVVGEMDQGHNLLITKSRCSGLADGMFHKPGKDVAKILLDWLTSGAPEAAPQAAATEPAKLADPQQIAEVKDLLTKVKLPDGTVAKWFQKVGAEAWEQMPADVLAKCIEYVRGRLPSLSPAEQPASPAAA
jgi:hypothetical protein